MSPPAVLSSTSIRSVRTMIGSPEATAAAGGGTGAVVAGAVAGAGAFSVVLGCGTAPGVVTVAGATTCWGALCFCHASHSISAETEKTTRAMSRWISIISGVCSGHRVETAGAPGMTTRDPAQGEPAAAEGAVPLDGLHRIGGARRREAAAASPPRAQQVAIGPDQGQQQARHSTVAPGCELVEEVPELGTQGPHLLRGETLAQCHDTIEAHDLHRMTAENLARQALHAVALASARHEAARKRHAEAGQRWRAARHMDHDEAPAQLARTSEYGTEGPTRMESVTPGKALGPGVPRHRRRQTAMRLRPLARRALITARPAAVFMRTRKPWVFLR